MSYDIWLVADMGGDASVQVITCENCGHDWIKDLPEASDPDDAGEICDICDSDLVSGEIDGA